ncbi:hypothetical protein M5K25_028133 [Dendrobium thyrsiflorum]|uniref:Uncharacterized protein n=1 Tax=Dendrobium thyrsiflorum TaxID=117978 RepID=A0ABD0TVJ9_DENTH
MYVQHGHHRGVLNINALHQQNPVDTIYPLIEDRVAHTCKLFVQKIACNLLGNRDVGLVIFLVPIEMTAGYKKSLVAQTEFKFWLTSPQVSVRNQFNIIVHKSPVVQILFRRNFGSLPASPPFRGKSERLAFPSSPHGRFRISRFTRLVTSVGPVSLPTTLLERVGGLPARREFRERVLDDYPPRCKLRAGFPPHYAT